MERGFFVGQQNSACHATTQVYLHWACEHVWEAGHVLQAHWSPAHAFWWVTEGAVAVRLPEATWRITPGEVLFTPRGCRRDVLASAGARWLSVGLQVVAPGGSDPLAGYQALHRWRPAAAQAREIEAILRRIIEECLREGEPGLISEGLGRVLLGVWLREGAPDLPQYVRPPWLERVLQQAQRDPALTVEDAARLAGYSLAHFRLCFQEAMGVSPQAYLQRLRMEMACALLADRTLMVAAIAQRLGFAHPAHFTRFFVRVYGQTPTAYRQGLTTQAL